MKPRDILLHCDRAALWLAASRAEKNAGVAAAYQTALAVRASRIERGERPVGYKIGFTNRTIWDRYGVHAPIWGLVWNTTLVRGGEEGRSLSLADICQPRLEPEVVFGIARTPPRDATLEQLFDSLDWLAPGFEVVQSHCADWKFDAADAVADGALHARLLVGSQVPVRDFASSGEALDTLLAQTCLKLYREDTLVDQGRGADVLDGPLHALHHFVREMQDCPGAPGLQAGDVVTTGTWTDAWPVEAGQTWRSEPGEALRPLEITFA